MDDLIERLRNFAQGCRGSMWQSRDETIRLCDEAATALAESQAEIARLTALLTKPLEWEQDGIYTLRSFGYVVETFRGPWPARLYINGASFGKSYRSTEAAIAAANEHHPAPGALSRQEQEG